MALAYTRFSEIFPIFTDVLSCTYVGKHPCSKLNGVHTFNITSNLLHKFFACAQTNLVEINLVLQAGSMRILPCKIVKYSGNLHVLEVILVSADIYILLPYRFFNKFVDT